eukprot:10939118-Lingulodinium_polyedra.AAC.1
MIAVLLSSYNHASSSCRRGFGSGPRPPSWVPLRRLSRGPGAQRRRRFGGLSASAPSGATASAARARTPPAAFSGS